jgi:hypothetical protein
MSGERTVMYESKPCYLSSVTVSCMRALGLRRVWACCADARHLPGGQEGRLGCGHARGCYRRGDETAG